MGAAFWSSLRNLLQKVSLPARFGTFFKLSMYWFTIVTIGHLLNAGSFLVNKFLLVKATPKAVVYTFWIAVLGLAAVVLLPFGYAQPSIVGLALAFVAGATFDLA